MSRISHEGKSALPYVNVLLTVLLAHITLLIATGGFDLFVMGLNLGACSLGYPAAILIAALAWRRFLLWREGVKGKGKTTSEPSISI